MCVNFIIFIWFIAGDMVAVLAANFDDCLFLDDLPHDRKQIDFQTFQVLFRC